MKKAVAVLLSGSKALLSQHWPKAASIGPRLWQKGASILLAASRVQSPCIQIT